MRRAIVVVAIACCGDFMALWQSYLPRKTHTGYNLLVKGVELQEL
jgi:hypothetical protein